MLSDVLIASGPVTYILCWAIVLLIILLFDPSPPVKAGLITYAVLPVGAACQTCIGYMFAWIGL